MKRYSAQMLIEDPRGPLVLHADVVARDERVRNLLLGVQRYIDKTLAEGGANDIAREAVRAALALLDGER